jgi:hypothetical protein
MLKKVLGWLALAFLIWYIATQPAEAASVMRSIGNGLRNIAVGFGSFVSGLT